MTIITATTTTTTTKTVATSTSQLAAAKKTKNKTANKKKAITVTKGFGSAVSKWEGCEDLQTWLTDRGSDVSGVSVGVVDKGSGLRGVMAAKSFKRGDVLFSIPREACIIDEIRADASPMAADIYPTITERNKIPPSLRVALYLLWLERNPTERQAWAPYLNSLPTPAMFKEDGGPMELWSKEEVEQVQCGQLIAEVHQRSVDLQKLYNESVLPNWTKASEAAKDGTSSSSLAGTVPPTFEEFQHAVCVVTSRSYDSMLVPGADMCNHNDQPPHMYHELSEAGDFLITAAKPIAKGEESKTSYGPLPNRRLLGQFGFVLPGPLDTDVALVRVDSLFSDNDSDDNKPATVESEEVAEELWTNGPGPARIQNLRAASTDPGLRTVQRSGKFRRVARWQPAVSARAVAIAVSDSEEEGIERFRAMIHRELASYSKSIEDDEAQLLVDSPQISPRMRLALLFRIQAKRMLLKELP